MAYVEGCVVSLPREESALYRGFPPSAEVGAFDARRMRPGEPEPGVGRVR